MPFDLIETERPIKNPARKLASISYKRHAPHKDRKGNGAAAPAPTLQVGIPHVVFATADPKLFVTENGAFGQSKARFSFFLGRGKDAGKARILRDGESKSAVPATVIRGGCYFRFGHVPAFGEDAAEKEFVKAIAVEGGFELDLPPWFKSLPAK